MYAIRSYYDWKAAEQGDALAQYRLGFKFANGQGVPKNETMAIKWFRKTADQGLPQSQYNLGSYNFV